MGQFDVSKLDACVHIHVKALFEILTSGQEEVHDYFFFFFLKDEPK